MSGTAATFDTQDVHVTDVTIDGTANKMMVHLNVGAPVAKDIDELVEWGTGVHITYGLAI